MALHQQLVAARKKKGLTQEELAELSKVTVRTIQRIESGETVPRAFTLKAIAAALDTPFEALQPGEEVKIVNNEEQTVPNGLEEDGVHFLQTLCLSCFCYLLIPFVHFLVPAHLLRKRNLSDKKVIRFARRLIQGQIVWVICLQLAMLMTVGYNLYRKSNGLSTLSYLLPAGAAYLWNAVRLLLKYNRFGTAETEREVI